MVDIATRPTAPTHPVSVPPDQGRADENRQRADLRTRELAQLLHRRPELTGVHAPADLLVAIATWAA